MDYNERNLCDYENVVSFKRVFDKHIRYSD